MKNLFVWLIIFSVLERSNFVVADQNKKDNESSESRKLSDLNTNDLEALLKKESGIYKENNSLLNPIYKKTIIITAANYGYINHLHNFQCFVDRLGLKFLVVSLENNIHTYITTNTSMSSYLFPNGKLGEVGRHSAKFRDKNFNILTVKKIEIVRDIMTLNYNVIFIDLDVALVRDPIAYLILNENVDYAHSVNTPCELSNSWSYNSRKEGNTGLYFVKSSPATIRLWTEVIEKSSSFPRLDDQAVFWHVIRKTKVVNPIHMGVCGSNSMKSSLRNVGNNENEKDSLRICSLDECMFSCGMLSYVYEPEFTYDELLNNLELRNQTMFTVHANYINGGNSAKEYKLKKYGFWLSTKSKFEKNFEREAKVKCIPYVEIARNKTYPVTHSSKI